MPHMHGLSLSHPIAHCRLQICKTDSSVIYIHLFPAKTCCLAPHTKKAARSRIRTKERPGQGLQDLKLCILRVKQSDKVVLFSSPPCWVSSSNTPPQKRYVGPRCNTVFPDNIQVKQVGRDMVHLAFFDQPYHHLLSVADALLFKLGLQVRQHIVKIGDGFCPDQWPGKLAVFGAVFVPVHSDRQDLEHRL